MSTCSDHGFYPLDHSDGMLTVKANMPLLQPSGMLTYVCSYDYTYANPFSNYVDHSNKMPSKVTASVPSPQPSGMLIYVHNTTYLGAHA